VPWGAQVTKLSVARQRAASEQGAAAVEFALIASVLLMLLFGILEYGRTFSEIEVLTSAAREGAREAAVRGDLADVDARVEEAAQPYVGDGGIAVSMSPASGCTDTNAGDSVTVSFPHEIEVSIAFVPAYHRTVTIKGVFRCE
jgi:Flp pilus assembly protein TadG